MSDTTIHVHTRQAGWHYWSGAVEVTGQRRAYLAQSHRHLFHIDVELEVLHDQRDVEFHDLLQLVTDWWPADGQLGGRSCETIARTIGEFVRVRLPYRQGAVRVTEDGECGARVVFDRYDPEVKG